MVRYQKPAALRHEKGSKRERNYNKAELKKMQEKEEELQGYTDKVDDVPDYLSDLGKEYYTFIVSELKVSGILSNLDIPILAETAETLAIVQSCDKDIKQNGMFIYNSKGEKKKNPAVDVRIKSLDQFKLLAVQLGMTPSSRASLAVKNLEKAEKEQDPLSKILNKKKAQ